MRTRRTTPFARSVAGIAIIVGGAATGAAGTVGWISLLTIPSVTVAALGVLFLGVVPIVVGLALIWSGLDVLSERPPLSARIPDGELVVAAGEGSTREQVVERLRLLSTDLGIVEDRLDDLVVREDLELIVTDAGELLYFAVPSRMPNGRRSCAM